MIRNLLASTALVAFVSTAAYAQDATPPVNTPPAATDTAPMTHDGAAAADMNGYLATQLIGETVYNGTADDAENIGKVNDMVIGPDGMIQSLVVGVGGFLGIGEKNVVVDYAQVDWAERDGDRWLVAPTTREQLEQQPQFDRSVYEPAQTTAAADPALTPVPVAPGTEAPGTEVAPGATDMNAAQAPDPAAPAMGTDPTSTAAIDRNSLTPLPATEIRANEMVGTTVYGADDANVGQIGDVVLTTDGGVDAYIVDVGGFLGLGTKEVAVSGDDLTFMSDSDGNHYLYTTFTKEQLDAAPAYDKSTYAERREDQRLIVR